MKRDRINRSLILLIVLVLSISISGCGHKDKETVVTSDMKKVAQKGENQVKKSIELGNKLLDNGDYDGAKKSYDKAIELDKKNKETYLTIEEKYLSKGRNQEAYDVIQEAVSNNVDTDNMKKLLSQLKEKLEVNNKAQDNENAQGSPNYKNNEAGKHSSNQSKSQNQDSGNSQEQNDTVESKKIFASVKSVYENNGKRYASIMEGQFYTYPQAEKEAEKDGLAHDEVREYYIRKISGIEDLEISDNAKFNVGKYILDPSSSGISNEAVSYSQFKFIENSQKDSGYYWLYLNSNNVVIRAEAQFIP
ncbi:tetratricopeptide repeat protein [Clostridium neuense]|uniref:Tetratricopeptide repeat protein n=1 Tax=Clostridium neuense TaxID=1728934 RepID=A0ABW8TFI8_9CLOT